jgi:hypothetical protein
MSVRFSARLVPASLIITLAAGLAACGGGGDAGTAATTAARTVDVYVGTWLARQCNATSSGSFKNQLVVTKVSDSQMQHSFNSFNYTTMDCTGTGTPSTGGAVAYTYTLAGSKTVEGLTVDKATRPTSNGDFKTVFFTDGRLLREGDDDSMPDSNGFPTAFETANYSVFDKQ